MIPKIIHYCWFGKKPKPELVERCMASWHRYMPSVCDSVSESRWTYMEWSEENFDILSAPLYVQQAYEANKYAFVSDYVRLWALEQYGGLYMDVDFEVYKSFEPLLDCPEGAFVGREGSKHQPPMLGVMASEPHGKWVTAMLHAYDDRTFITTPIAFRSGETSNGRFEEKGSEGEATYDMTTNVAFFDAMGVHKPEWVHIYPVDYFCPVLTTGERVDSENTYCEHKGLHSWGASKSLIQRVKSLILGIVGPKMRINLIKLKRAIVG